MGASNGTRLGNATALVRLAAQVKVGAAGSGRSGAFPQDASTNPAASDTLGRRRRLLVDLFRLIGEQITPGGSGGTTAAGGRGSPPRAFPADLSPRLRETLTLLLDGDGEKQIAAKLGVSRHTVHVYVKSLYRRFDVCSRAELLARFIRAHGGA